MDCEEFKRVSAGYLEDAVPPELRAEVEEHLRRCPVCAALVKQMKTLREGLRQALCKDCCPENLRQRISRNLLAGELRLLLDKLNPWTKP